MGNIAHHSSYARTSDGSVNEHDGPDNITVSPYGGVVLTEDGEGLSHLVGVTRQGRAHPTARNELNDSEVRRPGLQRGRQDPVRRHPAPGYVFAITGPWGRPDNGHGH